MVSRIGMVSIAISSAISGCYLGAEAPRELGLEGVERAFPFQEPDEIVQGWFAVDGEHQELEYEVYDGIAVFGGDIVLGPVDELSAEERGEREPDRSAVMPNRRWKNAIVPYVLDPDLSDATRTKINNAIKHWHNHTRIRFVKRKQHDDYVVFLPGESGDCHAQMGRRGGRQEIVLADECSKGNAIHEIGHTVGLYHEQSRTDRAKHIVIHSNNIIDGYISQFWTFKQMDKFLGEDFGSFKGANIGAYDFNSVMHYPWNAFSSNGKATITRLKHPDKEIDGQRDHLSEGDKKGVAFLYGAPGQGDPVEDPGDAEPTEDPTEDVGPGTEVHACWLTEVYRDVLGREPDTEGFADWVTALEGGLAPGEAVGSFVRSDEVMTSFLVGLYKAWLRREPDEAGLADWRAAMAGGVSREVASAEMLASNEYWSAVAGSDARRFVALLYTDVLGREGSAGEIDGWLAIVPALDGADARRSLALEFVRSPERRGLVVEAAYQRYLHRASDLGGKTAYLEAMDNGLSEEVMAIEFVTSPEYQQRCPW